MKTVEEVINESEIHGNVVKITGQQLERKLYEGVKKKLEGIGGRWKGGKVQGFVFPHDPTELLGRVKAGDNVNLKKDFQFFPTPPELADFLCQQVNINVSSRILEPSAGDGALVKAIQRVVPGIAVDVYELMPQNRTILSGMENVIFGGENFLEALPNPDYSVIVANPPFANNQDIDHVYHMFKFLADGGEMVSIMSKHWETSQNKKETEFRNWLDEVEAQFIPVARGAFKQSGTMIETIIVKIFK